jgi:hypothetical protein
VEIVDLDLGKELGAQEEYSTQRLTLYLPNKDKDGRDFASLEKWIEEARVLLSQIGRGATALPPADGTWLDEKDKVLWEQTRIVYCFIIPENFLANVHGLRDFVHRFGRETNQGEVVVEFDSRFFRIKKFNGKAGG